MTINKLKPEIKKMWVDALRSGKYKQGKGFLYNTNLDRYCCLGVLCDISPFEFYPEDPDLPSQVVKWAFEDPTARHNPYLQQGVSAIVANDTHDWTFEQIANAIEENL